MRGGCPGICRFSTRRHDGALGWQQPQEGRGAPHRAVPRRRGTRRLHKRSQCWESGHRAGCRLSARRAVAALVQNGAWKWVTVYITLPTLVHPPAHVRLPRLQADAQCNLTCISPPTTTIPAGTQVAGTHQQTESLIAYCSSTSRAGGHWPKTVYRWVAMTCTRAPVQARLGCRAAPLPPTSPLRRPGTSSDRITHSTRCSADS